MSERNEDKPVASYTTNDMSFAAYLIAIHDFKLIDARKLGKSYSFRLYKDDEVSINTLKYKFMGSDVAKFDSTIRDLKRILFSDNGR